MSDKPTANQKLSRKRLRKALSVGVSVFGILGVIFGVVQGLRANVLNSDLLEANKQILEFQKRADNMDVRYDDGSLIFYARNGSVVTPDEISLEPRFVTQNSEVADVEIFSISTTPRPEDKTPQTITYREIRSRICSRPSYFEFCQSEDHELVGFTVRFSVHGLHDKQHLSI